jgi:hypothetical protein
LRVDREFGDPGALLSIRNLFPAHCDHLCTIVKNIPGGAFLNRLPDEFGFYYHGSRQGMNPVFKKQGRKGSAGTYKKRVGITGEFQKPRQRFIDQKCIT